MNDSKLHMNSLARKYIKMCTFVISNFFITCQYCNDFLLDALYLIPIEFAQVVSPYDIMEGK